jgi:hypothetical protein
MTEDEYREAVKEAEEELNMHKENYDKKMKDCAFTYAVSHRKHNVNDHVKDISSGRYFIVETITLRLLLKKNRL